MLEATKYGPLPSAPRIMASAFEKLVKSVIKEVGGSRGELIPVDCVRDAITLRPYCLLRKKLSCSWFGKPGYTCVSLSIKDILEPSAPEPGISFTCSPLPHPEPRPTGHVHLYSSGPISRAGSSLKAPLLRRKDKAVATGIGL